MFNSSLIILHSLMCLAADKCAAPKIGRSLRSASFTIVEHEFLLATLLCTFHTSHNICYGAKILGISSNQGVCGFYPQGTAKRHHCYSCSRVGAVVELRRPNPKQGFWAGLGVNVDIFLSF